MDATWYDYNILPHCNRYGIKNLFYWITFLMYTYIHTQNERVLHSGLCMYVGKYVTILKYDIEVTTGKIIII